MNYLRPRFESWIAAMMLCICSSSVPVSVFAQASEFAVQLSQVQHLASVSTDNRNPVAAYSPDGHQLFVVWDGLMDGNRRILLRERIAGEWLEPVIVDNNPAGSNVFPSVSIDSNGTPHVAWITTYQGKRRPAYARRLARSNNSWHHQSIPLPKDSTVAGNCESVNLQLDGNDQPWISWQYGFGSVCGIAVSHFNGDGDIVSSELSPGANTLNLEPSLFFAPEPTVYWYVAQADQFYLVGSHFDAVSREWQISPPEDLDNLPADSLPDLFRTSEGPLAAIWYDRLENSEGAGSVSDHIYLGIQDPETKGRGEVIDQQSGSDYHSVTGLNNSGRYVTAWVSESYPEGEQIVAGIGSSPVDIDTITVSTNHNAGNSNPAIALGSSEATVVWEEEPLSTTSQIAVRVLNLR